MYMRPLTCRAENVTVFKCINTINHIGDVPLSNESFDRVSHLIEQKRKQNETHHSGDVPLSNDSNESCEYGDVSLSNESCDMARRSCLYQMSHVAYMNGSTLLEIRPVHIHDSSDVSLWKESCDMRRHSCLIKWVMRRFIEARCKTFEPLSNESCRVYEYMNGHDSFDVAWVMSKESCDVVRHLCVIKWVMSRLVEARRETFVHLSNESCRV